MDEGTFRQELANIGQKKLRKVTLEDYENVDHRWLPYWQRFLSQYEKDCWPIVRQFVVDSLIAEMEQSAAPGKTK
jgi:hypothetical protein